MDIAQAAGDTALTAVTGVSGLKAFRIIRITRILKSVQIVRIFRLVVALRTLISSIYQHHGACVKGSLSSGRGP